MQYVRIWRRTSDPEVHVPFLETLVSYSPSDLSDVIKYLCRLLDLYNSPHPRILNILWIIVLQHGHFLSWDQKASLLSVCSKRFGFFAESKILTEVLCGKMRKTMILGVLVAGHVFPRFVAQRLKDSLQQWVQGMSVAAFDLNLPLETRWSNLVLLGSYFKLHGFHQINGLSSTALTDEVVEWRTALILSTLEQEFSKPTSTIISRKLADVLRPVWRMWKSSKYDRPLLVSRVILASFLRLAGTAGEVQLFDDCSHYASLRGLWLTPRSSSDAGAAHILAAYVTGLVTCHGKKMSRILQNLDENISTDTQRAHVIRDLMQHFAIHDVEAAHELYRCCQQHSVFIPAVDVHRMAMNLATSHQIHHAVKFLYTPAFSRGQVEVLLGAILRHFQTMRLETLDAHLAADISGIMETLYNKRKPLIQLRYPIRFFLSMMVSSGYTSRAINVLEVLARISPSFFTVRFLARLIRALLYIRKFKHAIRVLRISKTMTCRSIDIVWEKTMFSLASAGAAKLSRGLYRDHIHSADTTRLSMLRDASFRIRKPTIFATFRLLHMFPRMPSNEQTVKDMVNLLVRARRLYAARKIAQVKYLDLKPETMTVIGNTILGGFLHRRKRRNIILGEFLHHRRRGRNGQLVARILSIRTWLEKTCQFIPDRFTTHIILNALLHWYTVDSAQLKTLFDRIIRLGYPSGNRELPQHGVPFGTRPTNTLNLDLSDLASPLSFRKHIRPLYKMFVKAFYLRNDVTAAKTIIAILRDETFKNMQERKRRERARREGLQRGKARIAQQII